MKKLISCLSVVCLTMSVVTVGCKKETPRSGPRQNQTEYDKNGFDKDGNHKATKTKFDTEGYNQAGFNAKGYNRKGFNSRGYNAAGFNARGIHEATGTLFNLAGLDQDGKDINGIKGVDVLKTDKLVKAGQVLLAASSEQVKTYLRMTPAQIQQSSDALTEYFAGNIDYAQAKALVIGSKDIKTLNHAVLCKMAGYSTPTEIRVTPIATKVGSSLKPANQIDVKASKIVRNREMKNLVVLNNTGDAIVPNQDVLSVVQANYSTGGVFGGNFINFEHAVFATPYKLMSKVDFDALSADQQQLGAVATDGKRIAHEIYSEIHCQ